MMNMAVTVVFTSSPDHVELELVEFQNGWFKFVDPGNRAIGPIECPAETVVYVGPRADKNDVKRLNRWRSAAAIRANKI